MVVGLPGQRDKIMMCTPNHGSATLSLIDLQKPSLSAILTVSSAFKRCGFCTYSHNYLQI